MINKIIRAYKKDDKAKELRKEQKDATVLIYKEKIYLPEECIKEVISNHHDDPQHGHPGVARTIELIARNYNAPGLKQHVIQYIKECISCQQNKSARHKLYGKIQFAPVPKTPWDDITMDFITKLPKSKDPTTTEVYDAIMVIVDRLTKYAIMLPFKEKYNAEQLAFLLLDRLMRDYSIPESITLDRDKLFTSNYWKTLLGMIGTKLRISTAYHPQTDRQTERANQTLEIYLRHYVNKK